MGDNAIIEVKGLSFSYDNSLVFKDLNFSIDQCSVTAIIGPSGTGKSTLLSCINRMNDYVEKSHLQGRIYLDGEDINAKSSDALILRKKIGMIFQKPNPFPLSIEKNILLPLKYHGIKSSKIRQEMLKKALVEVGLWDEVKDRLKKSASTLSGGQQQRLCIARAIALEPEVLLMDEPCSALDPIASQCIEDLIQKLRKSFTVIIVTHNLAQAQRVSNNTILLWNQDGVGYIADQGETQRVFSKPVNQVAQKYISGVMG